MKEFTLDQPSTTQLKISEIAIIHFLVITALYSFFAADFANKLLIYLEFNFTRVSIFFRSFYELLFFGVILFSPNKNRSVFLLTLFAVFLTFCLGQIVFSLNVDLQDSFAEKIFIFNKYFFLFIIYFAIYKLQNFPDKFNDVIRVMERLFLINAYLTIVGFIFSIDLLRTYINQSYRFGYSGVFWVQNEASLFCFLSISYFYYKQFILGIKSKSIYVVLIASLVLGTKAIYLFLAMLLLFHFLYHSGIKTKVITALLTVAIYWFVSWFLKTEQAEMILAYFISKMNSEGLWYMLFSGRTMYLGEMQTKIIDHWSLINYFVGGLDSFMIEMDLFDLYLFLGLFGTIIYFILLFATIFKFTLLKPFNLFFLFSFMTLALLGGHFFTSVITALYLCLISMFIYVTQAKPNDILNHEKNSSYQ